MVRTGKQRQPPNYQESVKAKEFMAFLRDHGVITEETEQDRLSRSDSGEDSKIVKSELHCGVRLLISNSQKESRIKDRKQLEDLLIKQAGFFMASMLDRVEELSLKIQGFLEREARKTKSTLIEAENMEVDFYVHGWATSFTPAKESSSTTMGNEKAVVPMVCGTPERRSSVHQERPYKVTPLAKADANVVNVGVEAGTSDDCLPKKIAQVERALTYVAFQANNTNIEQVVGCGALCMSVVDGASLGSVIINLNPHVFPFLAKLQKKGGLAYLFSRRSIFGDIDKLVDDYSGIEERLARLEWEVFALTAWSLTLTFTMAWALHPKR